MSLMGSKAYPARRIPGLRAVTLSQTSGLMKPTSKKLVSCFPSIEISNRYMLLLRRTMRWTVTMRSITWPHVA